MQLSKRQIKIILALLDLENAITTKELAEQFQMSIRTIKYDLDAIKTWFTKKTVYCVHSETKESG